MQLHSELFHAMDPLFCEAFEKNREEIVNTLVSQSLLDNLRKEHVLTDIQVEDINSVRKKCSI